TSLFAELISSALSVPADPKIIAKLPIMMQQMWETIPTELEGTVHTIETQTGGGSNKYITTISAEIMDITAGFAPSGGVINAAN
ncbi:hypothetical protein PMAYCL1PPCAC_08882, partial [Pristionchus mayeri]